HRGGHLRDGSHLGGQGGGQLVHVVGQVTPGAGGAWHVGLAAQPSFGAHLASDGGDLLGEDRQGVGHAVDGVGELGDLAFRLQGQLAFQVAVGDGGDHAGDASHLVGEVARHDVHVVGQVLPRAGDALHVGLATELAIGTHLTRHTSDFFGERIELVDHRVDGLLELEDLTADVDGDLLGEVALLHGGGDLGDVADLAGQVASHLPYTALFRSPRAGDALHVGLATELAIGTHLARHTSDFFGERIQLVDHRVDGLLELEDLAADVDGDLLGEV